MNRFASLLLLLASPCAAGIIDLDGHPIDEYTFAIEGRLWRNSLHGEIEAEDEDILGTEIDFEDELNLDSDENTFEGAVEVRLKRFIIRGQYFDTRFKETETLERTFVYDGTSFTASEQVEAEFRFRVISLDLNFVLVDLGSAKSLGFEVGVGIGVRHLYAEGEIRSRTTGLAEREDRDTFVPVVTVAASFGVANVLRIDAQISGIRIDYLGVSAAYVDGQIAAKVFLYRFVYASVGWRHVFAELEYNRGDDFDVEAAIYGPFIAVGAQF